MSKKFKKPKPKEKSPERILAELDEDYIQRAAQKPKIDNTWENNEYDIRRLMFAKNYIQSNKKLVAIDSATNQQRPPSVRRECCLGKSVNGTLEL